MSSLLVLYNESSRSISISHKQCKNINIPGRRSNQYCFFKRDASCLCHTRLHVLWKSKDLISQRTVVFTFLAKKFETEKKMVISRLLPPCQLNVKLHIMRANPVASLLTSNSKISSGGKFRSKSSCLSHSINCLMGIKNPE